MSSAVRKSSAEIAGLRQFPGDGGLHQPADPLCLPCLALRLPAVPIGSCASMQRPMPAQLLQAAAHPPEHTVVERFELEHLAAWPPLSSGTDSGRSQVLERSFAQPRGTAVLGNTAICSETADTLTCHGIVRSAPGYKRQCRRFRRPSLNHARPAIAGTIPLAEVSSGSMRSPFRPALPVINQRLKELVRVRRRQPLASRRA